MTAFSKVFLLLRVCQHTVSNFGCQWCCCIPRKSTAFREFLFYIKPSAKPLFSFTLHTAWPTIFTRTLQLDCWTYLLQSFLLIAVVCRPVSLIISSGFTLLPAVKTNTFLMLSLQRHKNDNCKTSRLLNSLKIKNSLGKLYLRFIRTSIVKEAL